MVPAGEAEVAVDAQLGPVFDKDPGEAVGPDEADNGPGDRGDQPPAKAGKKGNNGFGADGRPDHYRGRIRFT